MTSNKKSNNTIMNRRQQKRDEERAKYIIDYKREKQDVTALLESMNHIEAL